MKRSEVLKQIKSIISVCAPTQPTIVTADQILSRLEKLGMLPPNSTHIYPNIGGVNEWEPEEGHYTLPAEEFDKLYEDIFEEPYKQTITSTTDTIQKSITQQTSFGVPLTGFYSIDGKTFKLLQGKTYTVELLKQLPDKWEDPDIIQTYCKDCGVETIPGRGSARCKECWNDKNGV